MTNSRRQISLAHRSFPSSLATLGALATLSATLLGACGKDPVPDDLLADAQPFVAVPRASGSDVTEVRSALSAGNGAVASGVTPGEDNFYLAIRKDVLEEPWFLSAYLKALSEKALAIDVPFFSLGTRVVSFQVQNDKLFVFDVSGQRTASVLIDPPNLLEAYPIVERSEFTRLRGSERYVLIDPSAGLNRFGITSDLFEDWPFQGVSAEDDVPVRVGLAFMQNFRTLSDGVTYEEIFTGDLADTSAYTVWGTLGLTLRRYTVGNGYSPTPDPGTPHYFTTGIRAVPDSGGAAYQTPLKWNVRPGMQPVRILIGAGAARAQADFPAVDVLGAFKRGVEGWNDVFGFRVFEAVFVPDDAVRDDDKSFILVDYPGAGAPFAFADFRANPINGEIRGASVYFSGAFFQEFPYFSDDAPAEASRAGSPTVAAAPPVRPSWAGMPARPACAYPARAGGTKMVPGAVSLSADQQRALYIQGVVAHEIGHTLGLRHNFAGSLAPPSSSLMDYLDSALTVAVADPGPYDRDAVRYLYGLAPELPAQPFCTDEDISSSPLCQVWDRGADPLLDFYGPYYQYIIGLILDGTGSRDPSVFGAFDWLLNQILAFARDAGTVDPAQRTAAIAIALDRMAVPMSDADRASTFVVSWANTLLDIVLRRLVLDDPSQRGYVSADISDPAVGNLLVDEVGRMLRNEDRARNAGLRMTAVDVLKRLQTHTAFIELRASRDAIKTALADSYTSPDEVPYVEELLARIERALSPYFD